MSNVGKEVVLMVEELGELVSAVKNQDREHTGFLGKKERRKNKRRTTFQCNLTVVKENETVQIHR